MSQISSATNPSSSLASSLSNSGSVSVTGLVSGLDTNSIIKGLLAVEQQKITDIDNKKAQITTEQTAFKGVEAALLALQSNMTTLSRSQNGVFTSRTATSSDPSITAAASSNAPAGVYQLRVNSLAQANQIASQGFDSASSSISHGAFTLKVGDTTTAITVDSTNDTLQGLTDSINNSGAGVTAGIINDGSNNQAFRLVLTSNQTGVANRIQITNGLADTIGTSVKPAFDLAQIGAAFGAAANTSTAAVTSNAGTTATGNNDYHFTVVNGGTVGTDNGITLSYADATGANTGTITLNASDAGNFFNVAQGVQVKFAAGTLVAGDTFDIKTYVPTIQAASDASVTLGSGAGALTVTKSTNSIDSLVPGVALQLSAADPTKNISLTVANDTTQMQKAITDFVTSYNSLMSFINQQTSYDSTSQRAGPLLGDWQTLSIEDQVRTTVTDVVAGANPLMNHLGSLGITTGDNGQLVVDNTKLSSVLAGGVAGVTIGDVQKLFALSGSALNPGVQFLTGGTKTVASITPYTLNVTQAADKATLTSNNTTADSTTIDGTNNALQVSIDGVTSSPLNIPAATYTRIALAQALQSAINSDTTLAGRQVSVAVQGNQLTLTSNHYGSSGVITMVNGTALSALGFNAGASAQGHDVAGSFTVNGKTETAIGSGQFLSGSPGNANTDSLQLRVNLSAAQVGSGLQTSVTVSRGIASRLDITLTNLFDPVNGRLKTADDGFSKSLSDLDAQRQQQTDFISARQQNLLEQFNAMEQTLASLQSVSGLIGQSLSLPKIPSAPANSSSSG